MPTKLSYRRLDGGSFVSDLGFCRERPETVLKKVFPNYFVAKYKQLWLRGLLTKEKYEEYLAREDGLPPLIGFSGLSIADKVPNGGTKVTGTLKDLLRDLEKDREVGQIKPDFRRTKKDIRRALRELYGECIPWYLETLKTGKKYIARGAYDMMISSYFLDVIEATLGIRNPSINDIQRILKGNR